MRNCNCICNCNCTTAVAACGWRPSQSLHGGCPPVKGVKWAANSWLWNVPNGMAQWKT
jgi:hypothetical protein